jgi:multimeric flavodoxin WrbA
VQVTILNGEPVAGSSFDRYVRGVATSLAANGHEVRTLDLRDMNIRGCKGCWGCWVKTPGECVQDDDSGEVRRAVIGSDLTLLASPMRMGFVTSLLKRTADKLIGLIHPYIVLEGGEMHHRARYKRYPLLGLLLGAGADTDAEDIEITRDIWARMARNMKSCLAFAAVSDRPAEEVAHELASVA